MTDWTVRFNSELIPRTASLSSFSLFLSLSLSFSSTLVEKLVSSSWQCACLCMYVQASRGRAVQPRAGGNAIRARKCVATTDNAFCFDANATISSTASTAVTSVVVVRPLCASVSSHSSNSCHFPNIYFFFHQARKKLNYRYRRDKNKRFYYFNDKNMIEL